VRGISPQQNKDPRKKRERKREKKKKRGQGLKSERGETFTSYEEVPCFKRRKEKKRMKFTSCWERFYRKKKKKGDHIFL
jgi:hypothetical protein